ncbi:MAG: type II secretion system minor pseudopilin GspJ [Sphingobium sp.]|nr:type II secretion system minor pseudopilin GspJ [Sphingobium sp.]
MRAFARKCSCESRSPGRSDAAAGPWAPAFAGAREKETGFTLIELLVALAIFGLLAGAGVMLLRGSVDTQQAVTGHLDALADVQRGLATLDSDLAQATPRISRTRSGTLAPAFFGRKAQSDEPLMEFVRGGWSNPGNQRHPSIQKVEYWWRKGRIERVGYPAVDGAVSPEPATLFDHVTALSLRYRNPEGEWLDVWAQGKPEAIPVAVEMIVTREGEQPFTLRFLVGPAVGQGAQQQLVPPEGAPSNGV